MEPTCTGSAVAQNVKVVIKNPGASGTHQSPISLSVDLLSFYLHPSTAKHEITEYTHICFLDDDICAHNRFCIPAKWREGLRLAGDIGLLLRPRRDQIDERGAELERRAECRVHEGKSAGREICP